MYSLDQVTLPESNDDTLLNKPAAQKTIWHVREKWTDDQLKDYIRRYWGFCSYIDKQVGKVFDTLKQTGQWDNTIIIFTSDHGDMLASHGFIYKMSNNGYDELFRVPTLIRIPKTTTAGSSADSFVTHVDILPTLLEAADIPKPDKIDGKSFVPLLKNTKAKHRDFIFSDCGNTSIVYCDDSYKFVLNWQSPDNDDELYNLKNDPAEMTNLALKPENSKIIDTIKEKIFNWLKQTNHKYVDLIAEKAAFKQRT